MRRYWCVVVFCGACGGDPRVGSVSEGYTFTTQCPNQTIEGIDVYAGYGTIDWEQVKSSGRAFAFIKATQGDYNVQSTFAANWAGAHANGILASPYHFFDATVDGVTQAQAFLDVLNKAGGLLPTDLPPMLDLECPTSSNMFYTGKNCEGTGATGWVPTETLKQRTFDWLNTVEQATGRKAVIYNYPAWSSDVDFMDAALAEYPLYIASYADCAYVPPPWTSGVFWQYSTTGTVPGIPSAAGWTDLDRFFGTLDDLQAYIRGSTVDASTPNDMSAPPDLAVAPPRKKRRGCQIGADDSGSNTLVALTVAAIGLCLIARRRRPKVVSSARA